MFIGNVSILASENSEWNNIWPTKSNALDVEFTHAEQKTKQYIYLFQNLLTTVIIRSINRLML